ncbi:hypothetical protein [Streptomyces sp. NBC_00691]|uniref:hypothetical protein n=1 Tax=Streptomyces sp. NBC_00691 TaxID=2903671 RepID=UPI002E30C7C7|nr:hypothetical protein [Streptomyces sp. NBC_00691]
MNDDDYSATELGSHWLERPTADATPDRVEGDVLRFGPGVTTAALRRAENSPTMVEIWHGTLPGVPAPRPARSRWPRRYAFAAVVLIAVLLFLAWRQFGPGVAVRDVHVSAPGNALGCDGTANVRGVVRTDGRPGTVTYRWERSDGTRSGLLTEKLARGQKEASLRLLWTFHGPGTHRAEARLVVISPSAHAAAASFTYDCR